MPNPGRGGWGAVAIRRTETANIRWIRYGGKRRTTNNEMELTGALEALRLCPIGHDHSFYMDTMYFLKGVIRDGKDGYVTRSKLGKCALFTGYLANWLTKEWKTANGGRVKNLEIWKQIVEECNKHVIGGSTLRFQWVKGHSGVEGNELADQLASRGIPD